MSRDEQFDGRTWIGPVWPKHRSFTPDQPAAEPAAPLLPEGYVAVRREDVEGALRVIAGIGPDQDYECVHAFRTALRDTGT